MAHSPLSYGRVWVPNMSAVLRVPLQQDIPTSAQIYPIVTRDQAADEDQQNACPTFE